MPRFRLGFLSALSLSLVSTALPAEQPLLRSDAQIGLAIQSLEALKQDLGLSNDDAFTFRSAQRDDLQETHARFQQTYQGLPVWGGAVITHINASGRAMAPTKAIFPGIRLNVAPSLRASEALAIAHQDLAPKGPYAGDPSATLVIFPVQTAVRIRAGEDATAFEDHVVRYALAWHVRADLRNGKGETRNQEYMIDAHTGAILKAWNSLETGAAVGTGISQWYGTVALNTNQLSPTSYELRDTTRGNTTVIGAVGNVTTNLNHATSGTGTVYTDADDAWGDGNGYGAGSTISTTGPTGETAAVDAHRGLQATWDFYKNIFGRNGIDGTGKATYSRMHYSASYDNAFWDDTCFCMTYGDGNPPSGSYGEADLDTAGHEMSHGVCAATANLTYSSESGGLNESNSDIFGTCVEFYTLGGSTGSVIPNAASVMVNGNAVSANYTMFENSWGHPGQALRYMYRPDLDGGSANYWYSGVGKLDVHYSSGPNNRFFYFLAVGATATGDTSTSINAARTGVSNPNFLPNGMNGIGNDEAARIWYRALTTYLTSSSNYAAARTAATSAATDLYGANSFEVYTVQNAYHGINVGAAAASTAVKTSISAPAADQTVDTGTLVSFAGTGIDTIPTVAVTYGWDFGDGATATGASASHTYTNTTNANIVRAVTLTATDANGKTATATRQVTVLGDTAAPSVSASESGSRQGITLNASASDNRGVTKVELYVDGTLKSTLTAAPYTASLDSTTLADGSHSLTAKAYDAAGNTKTSAAVAFSVDNTLPTGAFDVLQNGSSVNNQTVSGTVIYSASPADSGSGVQRVTFYLDGKYYASVYAAPYTAPLDTTKLSNGAHTLLAYVVDNAGNFAYANPEHTYITASNADTIPPAGSTTSSGTSGAIAFTTTVSDPSGIQRVTYYLDGKFYKSLYAAPYSVTVDSTKLTNGTHYMLTYAVDGAGNLGYLDHGKAFTVSN